MIFLWKTRAIGISVVALTLLPSSLCLAQPAAAPANRFQVTVVRVKPDMIDEWLALQKNEVIPAQKKGGVTTRTTLQTSIGNAFEYYTIIPYPSFAALDGQNAQQKALGTEGAARLATKVRKCIDVLRNYLITRRDDLGLPQGTAVAARTTVRRIAAGKQEEYLNFQKMEVLPAMKKAKDAGKIAGYTVSMRGEGAQAGEVSTTVYYNKFADMDAGNPIAQVVGQAGLTAITAKGAPLATTIQTMIRRRVADLSF